MATVTGFLILGLVWCLVDSVAQNNRMRRIEKRLDHLEGKSDD